MESEPLAKFKSHIEGKNADVAIYADRIEWAKEGILGTGGKLALGTLTMGASLLKTGVSGKAKGSEMIPVKSISSVTTAKDGLRFTKVQVITSGNTIDFRVSHGDAPKMKDLIAQLILGSHPAQQGGAMPPPAAAPPPPPPPPPPPSAAPPPQTGSVADELTKLAGLRDAGVLTDDEFSEQKARLLGG